MDKKAIIFQNNRIKMKNPITIIFLIIISMTLISCNSKEEKYQNLLQELEQSFENGSEFLTKNSKDVKQKAEYLISDEGKMKYQPIIPEMEYISCIFSDVYEIMTKSNKLIAWPEKAIQIDSSLMALKYNQQHSYDIFLNQYGEKFGVRRGEIARLIEINSDKLSTIDSSRIMLLKYKDSPKWENVILKKIELELKLLENEMINDVSVLAGGRLGGCWVLPQVLPSQNIVKRGKEFKAQIGIMPSDFEFIAEDIELTIDGKIVPFDKGRFASYVSEPINSEQKTIHLSIKIRDKITNKFMVAWSDYDYTIETVE